MRVVFYLLGALSIVATLLPIVREEAWWIRIFDFPRLQIAVLGLGCLLIYLFFRNQFRTAEGVVALLIAACVVYQAVKIIPYTTLASKQVLDAERNEADSSVRLLISNVLMTNRNVDGFLRILRDCDPDIILTAETDAWWEERLRVIEKDYPFTVKHPLSNTYGMLLYSRLKLSDPKVAFLIEPDVPSMHAKVRMRSGRSVELHCLHPKPPAPQESKDTVERDAELLLVGKMIRKAPRPAIVMGDLNDVAWSYTTRLFQKVSGLIDPRIGRGPLNTFHARYFFLRFPLDHVFHSSHFKLVELKRQPYYGSDHFPVFAHLSYEPGAQEEQEAPAPDGDDLEEAQEKIEQAT